MKRTLSLAVSAGKIVFKCPDCSARSKVHVAKFRGRKNIIKIKCFCKKIIPVRLNFPQAVPEYSRPAGEMTNLSRGSQKSKVTIQNSSSTNIDVKIQGSALPRKGDKVKITYTDPQNYMPLQQTATVLRVYGKLVSCFKT